MNHLAGTSGFSYKEWKGSFYPQDCAASAMLGHYASRLPAVEINNTFYRMPRASVLEGWAAQVPQAFRFVIKASRRITHFKRLKDTEEEVTYLLDTAQTLGDRLGAILYQLPPNLKLDLQRLQEFLSVIAGPTRAVFEFRHPSWTDESVHACLREHGAALCIADADEGAEPDLIATADFGYLRLRRAKYDATQLRSWLGRIHEQPWKDVYVFFKHEDDAGGPEMAVEFLKEATS